MRSPLDGLGSPFGRFGRAGGGGVPPGDTITLAPLAATQFSNIVPVDFSASVPAGSRAYSVTLPEGLEVMTKAMRVMGSPVNLQSETTAQIVIVPPTGPLQYVEIPITVATAPGAVRTVTTAAELYAIPEFGAAYTGLGCTVNLTAGAVINLLTPTNHGNSGRFGGLTSPIIIRSVDPANRATITGKGFTFAGTGITVGNISFVDVDFDVLQTGSAILPGATLSPQSILGTGGTVSVVNVAAIRCNFNSDVEPGSSKVLPKGEVSAFLPGRPMDRVTIWGCTFTNMFNGSLGTASNMLFARNDQTLCWGDLFRCSPNSVNGTARYILCCDNFIGQSNADGLLRHADGLQMGGQSAGATIADFEQRGDIAADGLVAELPAITPAFWNANLVRASTNQTAGPTNTVLIRMETDVAAGNLTVQLPAIASVANQWQVCVQKYSGDTTHTVTVLRDGADTINGVGVNYPILGAWKAVRFFKNGAAATNWSVQIYSPGIQPGLYQDDGGLVSLTRGFVWACGATAGQFAGRSFEVFPVDVEVDYNTLVKSNYGDTDGDGIVDANDYDTGIAVYPSIQLRNSDPAAAITVRNSVAAGIAKDSGLPGTVTQVNNDTGQSAGAAAIEARFVGGGARTANRLDAINAMRHVQGGPLDGTGIGAVWLGLSDGPYDWINRRPRIPGAPNVVTRPVIEVGTGVIQIATAPVFSPTGTPAYQWYLDGADLPGQTAATLSTTGLGDGDVTLRCTLASALGDCIVDSLPLAYVASVSALFDSVNADGWSAAYTAPPTFDPTNNPELFAVSRQGYIGVTPSTITENLVVTQRIRQVWPNVGTLTSNQVALSDYIYSTDTIAGGKTNNSTEISPKPVANWAMVDRQVVGNTIRLEVVAFHRNARAGEQVAAVEFRATDGTTTVTQIVTTSSILGHSGDQSPVIGYACDLDVSTLANPATVTVNAKVYPHIGAVASVLDSADSAVAREFSPRIYMRSTSLAASPFYVYVTSAGIDATGAVSTNAATAEASPCLTVAGALTRIQAVRGDASGVIIRIGSGSFVLNGDGVSKAQGAGELIITRDPNVSRANAIVTFGAAAAGFRLNQTAGTGGWLRIRDLTITRTGLQAISGAGTSRLQLTIENCDFNNASNNGTMLATADMNMIGVSVTNTAAGLFNAATNEIRLLRGVVCPNVTSIESWLMLGGEYIGTLVAPVRGSRTASGSIVAYNRITGLSGVQPGFNLAATENVTGAAIVQNLFEFISNNATGATVIRVSGDGTTGNNSHVIIHNNTFAGFYNSGRNNLFYDDGATPRTSKLMSCRGNLHTQINTKSDEFTTNGTRTGSWPYLYGVGCDAEFSMFIDAANGGIGTAFAQEYPGLRADIGTSSTVRNDPLFTNYQGTTSGPTTGAGGGVYTIGGGSPCKAKVTNPPLRFDFDGNARSLTAASIGAYE